MRAWSLPAHDTFFFVLIAIYVLYNAGVTSLRCTSLYIISPIDESVSYQSAYISFATIYYNYSNYLVTSKCEPERRITFLPFKFLNFFFFIINWSVLMGINLSISSCCFFYIELIIWKITPHLKFMIVCGMKKKNSKYGPLLKLLNNNNNNIY